jgi:hypothetical protein
MCANGDQRNTGQWFLKQHTVISAPDVALLVTLHIRLVITVDSNCDDNAISAKSLVDRGMARGLDGIGRHARHRPGGEAVLVAVHRWADARMPSSTENR